MASIVIDPNVLTVARDLAARIASRFDVVEALLFGSHARGEAGPDSDIDVAFVLRDDGRHPVAIAADMGSETADVLFSTGRYVEAIPIKLSQWQAPDTADNPWFVHNVRRDGIAI